VSTPTTADAAPSEAPVEAPTETPEETAEANAASEGVAPEAPEAPPEPDKPSLAAEVMQRRDARQLAALVREKKQLEQAAAKYKEHDAKLTAMARIERYLEDGDDASAVEELLRLKSGDKAKERLATTYNALTERMLGAQNQSQPTRVERGLSRIEKDLDALKLEKAELAAKLEAKEAEERDRAIQGAKQAVGSFLKDLEHEHPFLMAEADEPEEIVWNILEAAQERGDEITLAQAAALANEHFQPIYERKKPRYLNLPAPPKASGDQNKPEAPPSQKSAPRKSITNADASQAASEKPLPPPRTEEERLDRSFAVLQRGLTKS